MRARILWSMVVIVPLIAAGCATHDVVRPGDRTFSNESPGPVVIPPPPAPQAVVVQPAPAPVVVAPGQSVVVQAAQPGTVVTTAPQVVQAGALEANEVRAQTIYANRIQAPEIRGTIHQSGGVQMDRSVANLKTSTVTASVVYADKIKADRVIADQIYVREVERR
jgi:hypothetical protein